MDAESLQPAAAEIQSNEFVCCKCWDGAIRLGRVVKFHHGRRLADLSMYQLDPSCNLFKKHCVADQLWQVPCELLAFLPRSHLTYDPVNKGYECSAQDLTRAVINHDRPAPRPQPLHASTRARKRTVEETNGFTPQRPHRSVRVPDRLSVAVTGGLVTSLEQQLQKAIRESLEEAKKAKVHHDDCDDSSTSSVMNGESRSSHGVEVKIEHTNGSVANGYSERAGRQRSKTGTKRHADADVNPLAKGVQKAELCADYVGVGVLNDRFTASIMYRGQQRFLGLFDSSTEAAKAYDEMAFRLLGYKAETNFTVRENAVPVFGMGLKQAAAVPAPPRLPETGQRQSTSDRKPKTSSRRSSSGNSNSEKSENRWWWEEFLAANQKAGR